MRDHITSEVGETLEVVAREVILELTLPESVRVESLSPFRVEQGSGNARVYLGDLVSGQVLTIALRLTFDFGVVGHEVGVHVRVGDRDGSFEAASPALVPATVAWEYADVRPTTRSRATWRWTGSWRACSQSERSRRPCGSTARAATRMRAGSSAPSGTASAATPAATGS